MRATPANVASALRASGYKESVKGRYGFTVRWRDDHQLIIVEHVPPDAQMAGVYFRILSKKWPCSQVGTYVAVHA